jgi:hypothetical protein
MEPIGSARRNTPQRQLAETTTVFGLWFETRDSTLS